jgi:hypothetical protein
MRFGREAGQRFVAWNQHRGLGSFNPCRRFRHHEDAGGDGAAGSGAGGDGDGSGDGAGDGDGDAGGASGGGGDASKTFNQDQVNAIMKREREKQEAKYKEQIQKQIAEVNKMKDEKDLTEAQRAKLDERAKALNAELLTEREKADAEKRRADEKHKTELEGVAAERDTWQSRYENQQRETAILSGASKHNAYHAPQLIGLISGLIDVAQAKDAKGNPINKFETSITAKVKEGEELVEKTMSVEDYIGWMKGQDEYANLFNITRPGGTGHRQGGGPDVGGKSTSNLSPTEKIAAGLGKGQATGSTGT